jgi:chromosome segregation ATPase
LHEAATKPKAEPPVAKQDGYLAQKPDASELGPDERLLLAEYSDTHAAKLALETQLAETRATIDSLQAKLAQTEEVRDRERTARASAEAELSRLRSTLQDRETKILSLHIEKAKLTQDLLLLRIDAAERQADAASRATAELHGPALPPPGGQR